MPQVHARPLPPCDPVHDGEQLVPLPRQPQEHSADAFGRVADRYGQSWTGGLLTGWFEERAAWDYGTRTEEWAARSLPGLCAGLHATGRAEAARRLLALAWEQLRQNTASGLTSSSPRFRDQTLRELGRPLTALLTAASATGAATTLATISGYIQQLEGDPVSILEMAILRAAADLRADAAPDADETKFRELAVDCAARLRDQLDRPRRKPGDWSITLPTGGCTCDLCAALQDFLAAPPRRTLEWPLAKDGRQHVHARIDRAEIPVTHVTRRQGRPYTLLLSKTDDLFTAEQQSRAQSDADLQWLATSWDTAS